MMLHVKIVAMNSSGQLIHEQDESFVALEDSEYQQLRNFEKNMYMCVYIYIYIYTHIHNILLLLCSNGGIADVRASDLPFVKESMGEGGLQVHVSRTPRCNR